MDEVIKCLAEYASACNLDPFKELKGESVDLRLLKNGSAQAADNFDYFVGLLKKNKSTE